MTILSLLPALRGAAFCTFPGKSQTMWHRAAPLRLTNANSWLSVVYLVQKSLSFLCSQEPEPSCGSEDHWGSLPLQARDGLLSNLQQDPHRVSGLWNQGSSVLSTVWLKTEKTLTSSTRLLNIVISHREKLLGVFLNTGLSQWTFSVGQIWQWTHHFRRVSICRQTRLYGMEHLIVQNRQVF